MLPSKHKIKLKCPTSLCRTLQTVHFPSLFFLHVPLFHFATCLTSTEGRAGTAWKTSDQNILLIAPYYNNNNKYCNFSASHCTPYSLFFSFFISTFTVKDITHAHSEHNKAIIGRQRVQESGQLRTLCLIRSNSRTYSSVDKR